MIAKAGTKRSLETQGIVIVPDRDASGSESKFCWNCTITGPVRIAAECASTVVASRVSPAASCGLCVACAGVLVSGQVPGGRH